MSKPISNASGELASNNEDYGCENIDRNNNMVGQSSLADDTKDKMDVDGTKLSRGIFGQKNSKGDIIFREGADKLTKKNLGLFVKGHFNDVEILRKCAMNYLSDEDPRFSLGFKPCIKAIGEQVLINEKEIKEKDAAEPHTVENEYNPIFNKIADMLMVHQNRVDETEGRVPQHPEAFMPFYETRLPPSDKRAQQELEEKLKRPRTAPFTFDRDAQLGLFHSKLREGRLGNNIVQQAEMRGYLEVKAHSWIVNEDLNEEQSFEKEVELDVENSEGVKVKQKITIQAPTFENRARKRGGRRAALEIALKTLARNEEQHFKDGWAPRVAIFPPDQLVVPEPAMALGLSGKNRVQDTAFMWTKLYNKHLRLHEPFVPPTILPHIGEWQCKSLCRYAIALLECAFRLLLAKPEDAHQVVFDETIPDWDGNALMESNPIWQRLEKVRQYYNQAGDESSKDDFTSWTEENKKNLAAVVAKRDQRALKHKREYRDLPKKLYIYIVQCLERLDKGEYKEGGRIHNNKEKAEIEEQEKKFYETLQDERLLKMLEGFHTEGDKGTRNTLDIISEQVLLEYLQNRTEKYDLHKLWSMVSGKTNEKLFSIDKWSTYSQNKEEPLMIANDEIIGTQQKELVEEAAHATSAKPTENARGRLSSTEEAVAKMPPIGSGNRIPAIIRNFDPVRDALTIQDPKDPKEVYQKGDLSFILGETEMMRRVLNKQIQRDLANGLLKEDKKYDLPVNLPTFALPVVESTPENGNALPTRKFWNALDRAAEGIKDGNVVNPEDHIRERRKRAWKVTRQKRSASKSPASERASKKK